MAKQKTDELLTEDQRILEALKETGVALEWQTAMKFEQLNYRVAQNVIGEVNATHDQSQVVSPETDVIAEAGDSSDRLAFVVECKGGPSSSALVLIESKRGMFKTPRVYVHGGEVNLDEDRSRPVGAKFDEKLAQSGDFLYRGGETKSGFRRGSSEGNLYKAGLQVSEGVSANFHRWASIGTGRTEVVPTIVTNVPIKLVRMATEGVGNVDWVYYPNYVVYTTRTRIAQATWRAKQINPPKGLPGVWVVHLGALEKFIRYIED